MGEQGAAVAEAVALEVRLPDAAARARAQACGRKPMAEVTLTLGSGDERQIVVPVRVGRVLDEAGIAFPCPVDDAFDAIHALEGRVCFAMITEILSRRDHAVDELRRKLSSYGFRTEEIEPAIARAQSHRFVDDSRFAGYFIEERLRRGWGRRRIEAELVRKGVDLEAVPGYPERYFSEEDDLARARAALERKTVPSERAFEKLVRFLVSRGFSYGIASDAVRDRLADS